MRPCRSRPALLRQAPLHPAKRQRRSCAQPAARTASRCHTCPQSRVRQPSPAKSAGPSGPDRAWPESARRKVRTGRAGPAATSTQTSPSERRVHPRTRRAKWLVLARPENRRLRHHRMLQAPEPGGAKMWLHLASRSRRAEWLLLGRVVAVVGIVPPCRGRSPARWQSAVATNLPRVTVVSTESSPS